MYPYKYRIVFRFWGFEPQMKTNSGLAKDFWMPLLRTGYWSEPGAFSFGAVKNKYAPMGLIDAITAIERAKLINSSGLFQKCKSGCEL